MYRTVKKIGRVLNWRRAVVFLHDLAAIILAFTFSFLIRFDFQIPPDQMENLVRGLPWIITIQTLVFVSQGLYRGLWAFASMQDLLLIARSVILAVGFSVAALAFAFNRLFNWPRSVFFLDSLFLLMILGGGRFLYRMIRENAFFGRKNSRRILIIGAGQSGDLIARELRLRRELAAKIVGFLDDDRKKKGNHIHGIPVISGLETLPRIMATKAIDEIIVAIPSLHGNKLRAIVTEASRTGVPVRIVPPIRDVLLGRVELSQLREVRVEDLLRRDVVQIDEESIGKFFSGKRVLVTGAGGSIGSELCRQILKAGPSQLILLDRTEFNLYRFLNELQAGFSAGDGNLIPVVGDILDERRMKQIFSEYRPQIVVHAAAYKHVPLMEANVYEALKNNVLGTYAIAQASAHYKAETFLFISTDKAVRPTNILGASKRMAERVAHEVGKKSDLRVVAVRFGNVLDSEGSALPLFRDQIARGGPVTVTHRDVTRYFMTIPEASSLVLQACVLGKGGEIFLLDMGEPVKIRELAEELIRLSGLKPYEDIEIQFTGLRPGEKLYEELLIDEKGHAPTTHNKIFSAGGDLAEPLEESWDKELETFLESREVPAKAALKEWICRWVPEYGNPTEPTSEDETASGESETDDRPIIH